MLIKRKLIAILPLVLLLNACGGGSSDSDNFVYITPNAEATYTGSRAPALLNKTNTVMFAELIFGANSNGGLLLRPDGSNPNILKNQPAILQLISDIQKMTNTNNLLKSRRVQESKNCEYAGSASLDAVISDAPVGTASENTGTLNYTFNNCENEEGIVINGKAFNTQYSSYSPEHYLIGYDNLRVTIDAESYSLTGTSEYKASTNFYPENTSEPIITTINLSVVHPSSGLSTYIKNYTFTSVRQGNDSDGEGDGDDALEGQVYISNEGYISLSHSRGYDGQSTTSPIPFGGEVYFSGAAQSIAKANDYSSYDDDTSVVAKGKYRLYLDQGGDGAYELYSLQDTSFTSSNYLGSNQPPIPVIEVQYLRFPGLDPTLGDVYTYGETGYTTGQQITLSGRKSEDLENDEFTYEWALESKPSGSIATLITGYGYELGNFSSNDVRLAALNTDIAGIYRVSLKVTDPNGSKESHSTVIDFDVSDPVYIGQTELIDDDISCSENCDWESKSLIVNQETRIYLVNNNNGNLDPCLWRVGRQVADTYTDYEFNESRYFISFTPLYSGTYSFDLICENSEGSRLTYATTLTASD